MLTSTVTVPMYGKLADLYGRKPVLLVGIAVFLAGSMASGLSGSIGALIAFRALQGLGAGAMQPTTLTIVGDIYNLEERARCRASSARCGASRGWSARCSAGLIVKYLSWHWVFFINVPAGIAAAALLVVALHENVEHRQHSLDWAGSALLTLGLTALLIGVQGGRASAVGLPLAAASLAIFFLVERRAVEPVLPLALFRQRVMAVATTSGALVGAGMISMVTYVPLYVQGVLGGSPTEAGSAITPMVIGWPIASAISGRALPRIGFRILVRSGLIISAIAAVALALLLRPGASLHVPQALSALFGVGLGLANTALLIAVQTSVEWRQRGVATASTMFARTIGGTLAVGVLGALLSAALLGDASLPADAASRSSVPATGPAWTRRCSARCRSRCSPVFGRSSGPSLRSPPLRRSAASSSRISRSAGRRPIAPRSVSRPR